jgi:hypothetical protein
VILLVAGVLATAQESINAAKTSERSQNAASSLATLPAADALIYVNTQRLFNEAIPKFAPEKDVADMRRGFEEVKKNVGVDPSKVEYLVLAVHFRKPAADLSFRAPEFMAVAGGDFSAETLVSLARMASGGKLRDEKYGSKTLGLLTIDPLVKEAEKNPLLKSYTEVAIVSLNPTTIAFGTPGYVKAAVDAADGTGRISADSLNSLLRDPTAIISIAGSPWGSFATTFGMHGTESNARTPQCESPIGNFYVGVNMDANNFMLRGSMNADNPDTAKIMANLISGLVSQAGSYMTKAGTPPDKGPEAAMRALRFTAEDNEVVLRADVPQQVVLDYIKEQMAPKKQEQAVTDVKTSAPVKKKTTVRRRKRS